MSTTGQRSLLMKYSGFNLQIDFREQKLLDRYSNNGFIKRML